MMEEEDDAEIEHVFIAHEIDLDYEFDAARFFDFTRPETPAEAHVAELWFQNAASYPPSTFVRRPVAREDLFLDNVCDSSGSVECTSNVDDDKPDNDNVDDDKPCAPLGVGFSDTAFKNYGSKAFGENISGLLAGILQNDCTRPLQVPTALTFGSKTISNNLNSMGKSAVPKSSTLMKPTASQLAKQNRPAKNLGSRFQKLLTQNEQKLSISSGVESQAAKRQKLEGGLLCKVSDMKLQNNFFHKAPMRAVTVEQNFACSRPKLTIPREPELKTAHRAQRIRPKNVEEVEHVTVAAPRFKARPLNRKILEAPSLLPPKRSTPRLPEFQEFHLKTLERAIQHTSATSSSLHCNDSDKGWDKHTAVSALENRVRDLRRPTAMGAAMYDGSGNTHIFKVRPLNKKMNFNSGSDLTSLRDPKILPSKGDGGVFQSSKQETTVPMEYDLQAEKEAQHNPPIELFSKLSLTSEGQPNHGSNFKLPPHSGVCRKEKAFMIGANKIPQGNGDCISMMNARRSLGIR